MNGNVYQWCVDYYDEKYYQNGANKDPQSVTTSNDRILRGGSWSAEAEGCRAAFRHRNAPGACAGDAGFRLCIRVD